MSFNRENVTWQSKDGTWNMAFFRTTWVGSEDEGYDPEWDVEYDYHEFHLYAYATGKASPDAAWDAVLEQTANPGGGWVVSRAISVDDCDKYDRMLEVAIAKNALQERARMQFRGIPR